jgi:diacylglycerol kinase (ATP)
MADRTGRPGRGATHSGRSSLPRSPHREDTYVSGMIQTPLMSSSPGAVRASLIVNTSSRIGAEALIAARAGFAAAGLADVHEVVFHRGDSLDAAITEALERDPQLLVVGGGDGTVACAAGRVAGTETVLGVIPMGTANDFARTMGIPPSVTGALDTLLNGHVVDVDLGRVNGHAFLNVASMGLSVGVTEHLSPVLKRRLGAMAYPVATLRAYRRHEPLTCRLRFPDGDHESLEVRDVLQLAVGNGVHYGGGNTVAPSASIDDDLLDVYAISRGRLHHHVSIARKLKNGSFVDHERVLHLSTRRLVVKTDRPTLVNADGELSATTPATFEVHRNAVHLIVPSASTAAVWDGTR